MIVLKNEMLDYYWLATQSIQPDSEPFMAVYHDTNARPVVPNAVKN